MTKPIEIRSESQIHRQLIKAYIYYWDTVPHLDVLDEIDIENGHKVCHVVVDQMIDFDADGKGNVMKVGIVMSVWSGRTLYKTVFVE